MQRSPRATAHEGEQRGSSSHGVLRRFPLRMACGTCLPRPIKRRALRLGCDDCSAAETLHGDGGLELRIERRAVVEDETFAVVMRAAHLFEVLEDTAFELIDVLDADLVHVNRSLLAADAARAKRDDS